jgi:hypothetical protein
MNNSWMHETNRFCEKYTKGVEEFIILAHGHVDGLNRIKCGNRYCKPIDEMEDDLFLNGICKNYT